MAFPLSKLDRAIARNIPPGGNWKNISPAISTRRLDGIRRSGGRTTQYGRLSWNKPAYTITTNFHRPGSGANLVPDADRTLTVREAARLQSFPDDYIFYGPKTSLRRQVGNAVPPLLAYALAKQLRKAAGVKTVVDLFAGAGGFSEGFEMAGCRVATANDFSPQAAETYRKNHPGTLFVEGDITNAEVKRKLLDGVRGRQVDAVIGGPPCQGFSQAGKRIEDDPRNFLFKEFVAIVKGLKPKVFVMENVAGILSMNGGKTFESIKRCFREAGYSVAAEKAAAVEYGVPQKRVRVLIVGRLNGDPEACFPRATIRDARNFLTVRDAIGDLPRKARYGEVRCAPRTPEPQSDYQKLMSGKIKLSAFLRRVKPFRQSKALARYRRPA